MGQRVACPRAFSFRRSPTGCLASSSVSDAISCLICCGRQESMNVGRTLRNEDTMHAHFSERRPMTTGNDCEVLRSAYQKEFCALSASRSTKGSITVRLTIPDDQTFDHRHRGSKFTYAAMIRRLTAIPKSTPDRCIMRLTFTDRHTAPLQPWSFEVIRCLHQPAASWEAQGGPTCVWAS